MRELQWLDLMFLTSGCKIFIPNAVVRCLNHMFFMFMLCSYFLIGYLNLTEIGAKGTFAKMSMASRGADEIAGVMFMIFMNINRVRFQKQMTAMFQTLTRGQRAKLSCHSFWSAMFVLLMVLQDFAATTIHITVAYHWNKTDHIIGDYTRSFHYFNSWFLGGCLLFAFNVKMYGFTEDNYFKSWRDKTLMSDQTPLKLAYDRRKHLMSREKLFRSFSCIPLLWFVNLFIKSTVVFIELTERYENVYEQVWRVMPLINRMLVLGYAVYLCDEVNRRTRKETNTIITELMHSGSYNEMELFANELKEAAAKDFNVFDTFVINRSFIMAFISSWISFTVLFLDVIYEYLVEEGKANAAAAASATAGNCTCP
jgi:hypothetical protein